MNRGRGMEELLKVKNLKYHFKTYGGEVEAVRGVSFNLKEGETLGIVGESGSGKSVTAQSILRLNQEPPGVFKSGNIEFKGKIISGFNNNQMRDIRGREISMIFQ